MSAHLINKVTLEISTGNLGDVNSLQAEMSRLLWQQAFPQMEQLFDQLVPTDEVVRLEQIVINLPKLDPHHATADFVPQLMAALERSFGDYLAGYQPAEVTVTTAPQSPTQSAWESLRYFLQYGRLPWWSATTAWESWLTRWQTALQANAAWQAPLRSLLTTSSSAIDRLVNQFPESFQHQLVLQLQPTWIAWRSLLNQAQHLMEALGLSDRAQTKLTRQAWIAMFTLIGQVSPYSPLPQTRWIRQWLPLVVNRWQIEISTQDALSPQRQGSLPGQSGAAQAAELSELFHRLMTQTMGTGAADWLAALAQVLPLLSESTIQPSTPPVQDPSQFDAIADSSSSASNSATSDSQITPAFSSDDHGDGERDVTPALAEEELNREQLLELYRATTTQTEAESLARSQQSPLSVEETQSGLFIHQAGLVLLHPFLRPYFEAVGLLAGDRFLDADCQQRAIYLLYYLATGQTQPPEYELVLPKLLCGWPLNDPVISPELPQAALDEAEQLLQTVINYWDVLKSTSPDGLREGFLQREGKVTRTGEQAWKLQVEQRAIDILLSRLPWGVSMVKLPWMDELLTVEWA